MTDDFKGLFEKYSFSKYTDILLYCMPAVRLIPSMAEDSELAIGSSKIGGRPDMPPEAEWPVWRKAPLSFLLQINLKDISSFPEANEIPKEGLLLFFYEPLEQTWGFDPDDLGSWRVLYFTDPLQNLQRRIPPACKDLIEFEACSLTFQKVFTLPPDDSAILTQFNMSQSDIDLYTEMINQVQENKILHQIFGHPSQIQGEMRLECELASNGLNCGNSSVYNDPRIEEFESKACEWILLLQLDSGGTANMMWGDCGRLYFWIRREDLAEKRFDKVWMILQCA